MRDDFDTFAEGGAFDHFWQLILVFSIAARFRRHHLDRIRLALARRQGRAEAVLKPPGRKPISAAIKLKVVPKTVKEHPLNATHRGVRTMGKEMGKHLPALKENTRQGFWNGSLPPIGYR